MGRWWGVQQKSGARGEGGRRESNLDRAGRSNDSREEWGGGRGGGAKPTLPKKELWSISEEPFPTLIHPGNPQRTESSFHAGGDTSTHVCTCS